MALTKIKPMTWWYISHSITLRLTSVLDIKLLFPSKAKPNWRITSGSLVPQRWQQIETNKINIIIKYWFWLRKKQKTAKLFLSDFGRAKRGLNYFSLFRFFCRQQLDGWLLSDQWVADAAVETRIGILGRDRDDERVQGDLTDNGRAIFVKRKEMKHKRPMIILEGWNRQTCLGKAGRYRPGRWRGRTRWNSPLGSSTMHKDNWRLNGLVMETAAVSRTFPYRSKSNQAILSAAKWRTLSPQTRVRLQRRHLRFPRTLCRWLVNIKKDRERETTVSPSTLPVALPFHLSLSLVNKV